MPDPTLTRYSATSVDADAVYVMPADSRGAGLWLGNRQIYLCEEADRLIQALREQFEGLAVDFAALLKESTAEVGAWRRAYETLLAVMNGLGDRWSGESPVASVTRWLEERAALRRALDAAQQQHRHLRDWLMVSIDTMDDLELLRDSVIECLAADAEARPSEP